MDDMARKLTIVSVLWLIVISLGGLGTSDTDLRLRMAHAWWSGEPEVYQQLRPPASREDIEYGVVGKSGRRLLFYDPGQSLLMLPADYVATRLNRWFKGPAKEVRSAIVGWTVFIPLNALAVLACFYLLRLFGVSDVQAAVSSLLWLLATTVLPYAQTAFQNNQVLLFVIVAHAGILAWVRTDRSGYLVLSGAMAGMALLMRASSGIHIITIGLFLIACAVTSGSDLKARACALTGWFAGFVPPAIAFCAFNWARFGGPFTSGQALRISQINSDPVFGTLTSLPEGFHFVNHAEVGILGVLFSPAKSLFLYDPLFIPCLIATVVAWKRLTPYVRAYVALMGLNLVLHIGITSKLDFWHGDWAWAARYHVTSVDLLMIPMVPLLIQAACRRPLLSWTVRACIAAGLVVQVLAVSMPISAEVGVEALAFDATCEADTWNTRQDFRIGNRFRDLYCLTDRAHTGICADPAVVAEARTKPVCADTLRLVDKSQRLAFFPFNPQLKSLVTHGGIAAWLIALLGAILLTWRWCGSWLLHLGAELPIGTQKMGPAGSEERPLEPKAGGDRI
jgi:hypothetical protein